MVFWKMRSLGKFYPSLGISHNLLKGLWLSLRFCVCRSQICFSIKSLRFFVSGSDFKTPVSASRWVSDLPFATPKRIENGNGIYIFIWYTGISHTWHNWDWDFEKTSTGKWDRVDPPSGPSMVKDITTQSQFVSILYLPYCSYNPSL